MHRRSPSAASGSTGASVFSTGIDSPVRADSSTRRLLSCSQRRSAGRLSPEATCTTSPGTRSAASMSFRRPSRNTMACGASRWRMACSAFSALPSCNTPMSTLNSTTARITPASSVWPISAVTTTAASSTMISRLLNCASTRRHRPGPSTISSRLGPCCCRRSAASRLLRPASEACSAASACSVWRACQGTAGADGVSVRLGGGGRDMVA